MATHNTRERIEEWEKKFDEMWTILDFEVCTRDKSMNTQTLDDYESAQSDDIKDFIHQELQKAREEERKKNRIGQIKDVQDQVRKKKEHGKAMYEKGRRDARHDWLREEIVKLEVMKITNYPSSLKDPSGFCQNMGYNKALQTIQSRYQSKLDQPTELFNTIKKKWDKQAEDSINGYN